MLSTSRLLCAICAVVYPLFWVLNQRQAHPYVDPLLPRAALTVVTAAIPIASFHSAAVRKHLSKGLVFVVYAVTAHIFALVWANDLDQSLVIGAEVALAGFIASATYTIRTQRELMIYLVYVAALAIGAAVTIEHPRFDPGIFLVSVGVVLAMAFVSVSSHLVTLTRLVESEHLLRADIEGREASEIRLRRSEAHAHALLDAVPDTLVRLARGGVIVDVRNDDANSFGQHLRANIGRPIDDLVHASPGSIADAVRVTLESGGVAKVQGEASRDGESSEVEVRVVRTSPDECLALVRDVTQERRTEARLRVAERLASLGTLASGVAHEINNPLSYVIANVDYVVDALERLPRPALDGVGGDDLVQALREIREGGRRIGSIVGSLKTQARQDEALAAPADVNEGVESALRILDNQLRYKTRVETALGRIPYAIVHPQRLVQVVVNLLANALDAFPERSSDQNLVRVETRVSDDDESVIIEVTDNGTGMPEATRERIFDPFFTTKAPGVGTGLGLYLCHQYVSAAGGSIDVESREGHGSVFRVRLPAVEGGRISIVDPRATPLPPSRILVVDDEPLVARSLARMLRGHEIVFAGDGEAALWECLARDFDLVLCDVMMPRMDGPGFYAALREHRPALSSRIVFMTGGAFTAATRSFLESVPNVHVEKPIQPHRLFDAARRQLAAADAEREKPRVSA
ncbi:MAG TPA: ATP-binding protein [Polyangiaceae bacterium]|nr:ATP-binding protein [Polyangiaceae bacterium]